MRPYPVLRRRGDGLLGDYQLRSGSDTGGHMGSWIPSTLLGTVGAIPAPSPPPPASRSAESSRHKSFMTETIGTPNGVVNRRTEGRLSHDSFMVYDGGKIALLRKAKGLSMAELARRSSIKQPSLWALEHQVTKKPKADTLMRVAAALGVPMRELLRPGKKSNATDLHDDLHELFDQLDGRNQQALIAAARALKDSQKK
jgi:transcriptional regulator with XRE-family HTH domain